MCLTEYYIFFATFIPAHDFTCYLKANSFGDVLLITIPL